MFFSLFQGALRESVVKADNTPIWSMFHYNAQHTGQCPYDTSSNNGAVKWKFKTGNGISSSPAISSDGTIYVGSEDNYLYAISPNGILKWKYETGKRILSFPAISSDGTIYVGSWDHYLYALNPDGTLKWKYQTGDQIWSSPAISSDGTIYVGSEDHYLYALNPDGTLKWKYETGSSVGSSPAIASDGTIYVGSGDHYLYALNPDGTLKWKYETGSYVGSSPAISSDGTIYVGSWDHYLYALNPDGTLKWKYETGSYIYSSPAIASDGTIYVGSYDHYLYALNPDGTLKWKYETGNTIPSSPAIASDGTIYVGSYDHYLYALNPDGTLKWKYETGNAISSSPAISSDGTIYVGSIDGYLYAIGTYTITASAGNDGTITPSGNVTINYGNSKTFTIMPDSGYKISNVKVDGVSKGAISSYTFTNITSNHTIEATFEKEITQTVIILQIGKSTFTVNGETRYLDSPPVIKNSRTLLPIRAIIEALGGKIEWNGGEKKVTITVKDTIIELWIGKSIAKVNGIDTPIDSTNSKVVPEIINSRTMLPLRFITENLGCDVQWEPNTQTITITYPMR